MTGWNTFEFWQSVVICYLIVGGIFDSSSVGAVVSSLVWGFRGVKAHFSYF